jgi:DNA-binding CsgD family transcriptional regulator
MWPEAGFELESRQLALLDLSRGRYGAAFERLPPITRQDRIDFGILILADFSEAAARSGRPAEAKAALDRLALRATAAAAPLGLGTLARCRAFLSDEDQAEGYYRESIVRLADANSAMELARSCLVLGEWLRRQRRRRDARSQLKIAYSMFSDIGATGFSERAHIEFLATGGAARERCVETANDLTPQETQIARLVASGETNREVAAELFISPATVDYHMRKVFQKLDVSSRTQLALKIAVGAAS